MDNNDLPTTHGEEPRFNPIPEPGGNKPDEPKEASEQPKLDLKQPFLARTIATGDKIFFVFEDQRRWIMSPEVLHGLGFEFGDEKEIKYSELTQFSEGEPVSIKDVDGLKEKMGGDGAVAQKAEQRPVEAKVEDSNPSSPAEDEGISDGIREENFYYEVDGKTPEAIFIVPLIRPDYIKNYLDTLYKYTPIDFKVIVIDQTLEKTAYEQCKDRVHLWINSYRNLGFSKAHNTGAALALRENPKYIVFSNDDIEFMNKNWWQGIMDTFATDDHIIGVNPNSPRIAMWGYGVEDGYFDLIDYKPEFTDEDYNYLLAGDYAEAKANRKVKKADGTEIDVPDSFPAKQSGVIDAVATWCTVFRTDKFKEVGMWDERFFPGSGEDYDMMARAYSRAYPNRDQISEDQHYRVVGTMRSWAWHHWTRSKDYFKENPEAKEKLMTVKPNFSDAGAPWRELSEGNFDVWGNYDKDGVKTPIVREKKIVISSL